MTDGINKIKEYLEVSHAGAMMMGNEEDALRISRALAALLADTDKDIFSKKFERVLVERMMVEDECKTV